MNDTKEREQSASQKGKTLKEEPFSEKASPKTIGELVALHDAWLRTFEAGANGNQEAYALARDTRSFFENSKWINVEGLLVEIKNLRDTSEISVFHAGEIHAYEKVLTRLGCSEKQKEESLKESCNVAKSNKAFIPKIKLRKAIETFPLPNQHPLLHFSVEEWLHELRKLAK